MIGVLALLASALGNSPVLLPEVISQSTFTAIVGVGILGSMVVAVIIIAYTVVEFRRHEIW